MNRNNIWIHVGLAVVLITMAAVVGQVERWRTSLIAPEIKQTQALEKRKIGPKAATDSSPELLVRFKPGVSLQKIREIASANHDVLKDEVESVSGLTSIDDLDNADPKAAAAQYAALLEYVAYAEPNFQIELDEQLLEAPPRNLKYNVPFDSAPNDPMFGDQYALNNSGQDGGTVDASIHALTAWTKTKGSEDVVVAVLDTGVDYTHEDLVANMWIRPKNMAAYTDDELGTFNDLNGFNGTDKLADPMDDNGHGTHCAGIIGAKGDNDIGISGINQTVKIMPLKFLGRGGFGSTDDAIEAINYAIDRKRKGVNIRIISASWGSTSRSKALEDTIRAANDAGILFVAAAGNDGSNNDNRPHFPSNYDLPNVISVAALDRNDKLASFSNYGTKTVHIAAPGKDILSTWLNNSYREASGTSMATPYVSGVAALIIASEPDISLKDLRARLLSSVDKLNVLDGKVESAGRVCAANSTN